jgi:polysaccharide biosynthesis protein PslG
MKKAYLPVVFLALTFRAPAGELPALQLPQGVGVNIHFVRGHTRDLDLIAAAGFKVVRMDFSWSGIERKKGHYDWVEYDELTANLEKRRIRPMYILDYSNPLYEETVVSKDPLNGQENRAVAAPSRPESVAAFARWAAAAVRHYQGRHVIWEIWNEPNIGFWRPKPDARQYATLALATCKAVREADPGATLVAPATSEIPLQFLDTVFSAGVLGYLDAVSVHPYRPYRKPPESAVQDYPMLRELMARHMPAGKKPLPILSGEWGYAAHQGGVSRDTQAAYLARMQLSNLLDGVPLSIWYDWRDDGTNPKEREHNFGVVTNDLQLKPAYSAVQTLTRTLSGYRIERRLDVGGRSNDYALRLVDGKGGRQLAAWTLDAPHTVTLTGLQPAETATGVESCGAPFTPRINEGALLVELAAPPKYVALATSKEARKPGKD